MEKTKKKNLSSGKEMSAAVEAKNEHSSLELNLMYINVNDKFF